MKSNNSFKSDRVRKIYQIFKEYPVKSMRKKVDVEQLYIVPWEMMEDDTKRWSLKY